MVIEMVAYTALHQVGGKNFRCVVCQELTQHDEEGIWSHLVGHGFNREDLSKDPTGEIFFHGDVKPCV